MDYLSVKEAALKFGISERRVQQICEAGKIDGAQRISGIWLIPKKAKKPFDDRVTNFNTDTDEISLNDLCKTLSISVATGRNWLKLGKIEAHSFVKKTPYFKKDYVNNLLESLKQGDNKALKSRRNKKYISGNNMYNSYVSDASQSKTSVQKVLDYLTAKEVNITNLVMQTILAECALQLLLHENLFATSGNCLKDYLDGKLLLHEQEFLVTSLLDDKNASLSFVNNHPDLFAITYQYENNEDILGLLYISIKNLGERKATGSYYTPTNVVKKLCAKALNDNKKESPFILDPCCGTGNFLLQLPNSIDFKHIYGNDIDLMSVKLTRINMSLKHGINDQELLEKHITNYDYLQHDFDTAFDIILGNPPWGYDFTDEDKTILRDKYESAIGSNIESYDVFIEQAIRDLKPEGMLSFVLPEALLNVKTHTPIRSFLLKKTQFQYLSFLGNAFDKVQCPCIIFSVLNKAKQNSCLGLEVENLHKHFQISTTRNITEECFSFLTTDDEYKIINKISLPKDKCYLENHAKFALGIVTGNNKEYISDIKTTANEIVLKGSDVNKYKFIPAKNYLEFKPELFQQVAPTEFYRAPEKLLYRFICNQLVFAYDNQQTLSLNSCNILIPQIESLDIKYILAILNSRVAQYYFKNVFNSVKILRSHIEKIPIPIATKKQQQALLAYVETLLTAKDADTIYATYDKLDTEIANLYNLSDTEYQIIKNNLEGQNLFLC